MIDRFLRLIGVTRTVEQAPPNELPPMTAAEARRDWEMIRNAGPNRLQSGARAMTEAELAAMNSPERMRNARAMGASYPPKAIDPRQLFG